MWKLLKFIYRRREKNFSEIQQPPICIQRKLLNLMLALSDSFKL